MKTKTIIVGIPESKGKNAIKKKTSTEFKSQFKFENFIQDDFEAELFALLTKQENKHYGGGVISFIHAFRTLFKTLKISSNLKTFIANFKGRYEYIYNTSRYSIAEKIFFIRVYKEYLEWSFNNKKVEGMDKSTFRKCYYFLESFINYLVNLENPYEDKVEDFENATSANSQENQNIRIAERIDIANKSFDMLLKNNGRNHKPILGKKDVAVLKANFEYAIRYEKVESVTNTIKKINLPKNALYRFFYELHTELYGISRRPFFLKLVALTFDELQEDRFENNDQMQSRQIYKKFTDPRTKHHAYLLGLE